MMCIIYKFFPPYNHLLVYDGIVKVFTTHPKTRKANKELRVAYLVFKTEKDANDIHS